MCFSKRGSDCAEKRHMYALTGCMYIYDIALEMKFHLMANLAPNLEGADLPYKPKYWGIKGDLQDSKIGCSLL